MSVEEAKVKVFDKWHEVARQVASYGEPELSYFYAGRTVGARPWTPLLAYIKEQVEALVGDHFNYLLVNRYKDGQDHIGRHRDHSDYLDPAAPIASVSFGAGRDFILDRKGYDRVRIYLTHGMVLTLDPPTNDYWYHSVPVRAKVTGPRINLTFRRVNVAARNRARQRQLEEEQQRQTAVLSEDPPTSQSKEEHIDRGLAGVAADPLLAGPSPSMKAAEGERGNRSVLDMFKAKSASGAGTGRSSLSTGKTPGRRRPGIADFFPKGEAVSSAPSPALQTDQPALSSGCGAAIVSRPQSKAHDREDDGTFKRQKEEGIIVIDDDD